MKLLFKGVALLVQNWIIAETLATLVKIDRLLNRLVFATHLYDSDISLSADWSIVDACSAIYCWQYQLKIFFLSSFNGWWSERNYRKGNGCCLYFDSFEDIPQLKSISRSDSGDVSFGMSPIFNSRMNNPTGKWFFLTTKERSITTNNLTVILDTPPTPSPMKDTSTSSPILSSPNQRHQHHHNYTRSPNSLFDFQGRTGVELRRVIEMPYSPSYCRAC